VAQRFWAKVQQTAGCWEWQGARHPHGYGKFTVDRHRRGVFAHRFAYELTHGPIPPGMHVCHTCDNPPCVRPDHLELGTPADNMRDRDRKGRRKQGRQSTGARKLTPDQVQTIRARYAAGGVSQRALAAEYGCGQNTIGRMLRSEEMTT
jgi:hypothetical protein